jgi:hypothetical protein
LVSRSLLLTPRISLALVATPIAEHQRHAPPARPLDAHVMGYQHKHDFYHYSSPGSDKEVVKDDFCEIDVIEIDHSYSS